MQRKIHLPGPGGEAIDIAIETTPFIIYTGKQSEVTNAQEQTNRTDMQKPPMAGPERG